MTAERLKTTIEVKRLNELFSLLPITALGSFLLVTVFIAGLINEVTADYLWGWLTFVFFVFLFNLSLVIYFKKYKNRLPKNIKQWQIFVIFNSLLNGLSWGGAGAFFYILVPNIYQAYLLLALVMVLSSYFPVFVHYYLCFCVFALSLILPISIILFFADIVASQYMALMLVGYLGLMLAFAKWFNRREYDRIRLQAELYEQNDKVKAANDSKSRFLASASHDLRQPLQALGFYIVMLSDFLREPRKKTLFDKTLKAYQALENLLNQLLNISKLNANLVNIVKSNFSIIELFEKLKNDYELRAMDKGLSIEFVTQDYFAYSDVVSVERILRNLLENALCYTNQGFIKATCLEQQGQLVLSVADSGIGIDKSHIEKIFDEFYQVKNPERDRSKGFGLGLYAVDRLAKLLDTKINVVSKASEGSVFSIQLAVGSRPQTIDLNHTEKLIGDSILNDKIILLVDDDDVVLDSISRLFLTWRCQILTADSYKDAINIIVEEEIIPDLIVVDYRLPNHHNGVDLVEEFCLLAKKAIPAVILTGDTGEESLTRINQSGFAFMHKPADPEKLKIRVKSLLENSLSMDANNH